MNYRVCFSAYLRHKGYSATTIRAYTYALADFKAYCLLNRRRVRLIKTLHPGQLEGYKQYVVQVSKMRPSTANRRLTGLSAFARFLISRGQLDHNPLELVARLRPDGTNSPRAWASWDAVQELRREINHDVLELPGRLIVELLYTGITTREIRSLLWENLTSSDYLMVEGRQVKLHQEARLALDHYLILRPILIGNRLVVGNSIDGILKPGEIYTLVRRFSQKIGKLVTIRDLRLAQFALAQGILAPAAHESIAA